MFSIYITHRWGKQECVSTPKAGTALRIASHLRYTLATVRVWDHKEHKFIY